MAQRRKQVNVALDPSWHEHDRLLRLQAALRLNLGIPTLALVQVFEHALTRLEEELGVTPTKEIREEVARIKASR